MNRKPGRVSSAELRSIPVTTGVRSIIEPGRTLTALEAKHWRAVVQSVPLDFFALVDAMSLTQYVTHAAKAEALSTWLSKHEPDEPSWCRISLQQIAHSKAALAHAKGLRLVKSSRSDDRDAAATAVRRARAPATLEELKARYAAS